MIEYSRSTKPDNWAFYADHTSKHVFTEVPAASDDLLTIQSNPEGKWP